MAQLPSGGAPDRIRISSIRKSFRRRGGAEVRAVDGISLNVKAGEIVVLLGPSGCGKTTLLRCIAGLEDPSEGEIELNGRLVFSRERKINLPPEDRGVAMIFQGYAVWPHMTVFDNVAYPLRAHRVPRTEIRPRVIEALQKVGIESLADQFPQSLSGGQQQRVALARSLVVNPAVILFDEPLSNVDARLREQLRNELVRMQRALHFSAIYVTHDQHEAMAIADRLAIVNAGQIEQLGTCRELYRHPANTHVAGFLGGANVLSAKATSLNGQAQKSEVTVTCGMGQFRVPADQLPPGLSPNADLRIVIRPQDIVLSPATQNEAGQLRAIVRLATFLGTHMEYVVEIGGLQLDVWSADMNTYAEGEAVSAWVDPQAVSLLSYSP